MADLSVFKCISCYKEYDIQEIRYRCECGDLLEVIHELDRAIPDPESWKKSLDEQLGEVPFRRYQNILFPSLLKESIISLKEGDTPL